MFPLFFEEKNIVKLPKAVIKTSEYFKMLWFHHKGLNTFRDPIFFYAR